MFAAHSNTPIFSIQIASSGANVPLRFMASENSELLGGGVADSDLRPRDGTAPIVARRPNGSDADARCMMGAILSPLGWMSVHNGHRPDQVGDLVVHMSNQARVTFHAVKDTSYPHGKLGEGRCARQHTNNCGSLND